MPPDPNSSPAGRNDAERIAQLEARLARIEAHFGFAAQARTAPTMPAVAHEVAAPFALTQTEDDLEFKIGQSWFALAGIVVLTIGAAFLLSLRALVVAANFVITTGKHDNLCAGHGNSCADGGSVIAHTHAASSENHRKHHHLGNGLNPYHDLLPSLE